MIAENAHYYSGGMKAINLKKKIFKFLFNLLTGTS